MSFPGPLHPEPLPLLQATDDHPIQETLTLKGRSSSVSVEFPGIHKIWSEPSECLWKVCDLILNVISPLLLSCWDFSFALGHGVYFFGGIQRSSVDGCSAVSCNFGVLTGEDVLLLCQTVLILNLAYRWKIKDFYEYQTYWQMVWIYLQILAFADETFPKLLLWRQMKNFAKTFKNCLWIHVKCKFLKGKCYTNVCKDSEIFFVESIFWWHDHLMIIWWPNIWWNDPFVLLITYSLF